MTEKEEMDDEYLSEEINVLEEKLLSEDAGLEDKLIQASVQVYEMYSNDFRGYLKTYKTYLDSVMSKYEGTND